MNRLVVLLLSVVLAMPVQALDLQGLYEQALTASRQGDFVEALPLWDRFLEEAPDDAAALSNRGNVRLALGDPSGAIADQTASIVVATEESDPRLFRGTAEEALQDWSAAAGTISGSWSGIPGCPSPLQLGQRARFAGTGRRPYALWPGGPAQALRWPAPARPWRPGRREISIGRRRNCAS